MTQSSGINFIAILLFFISGVASRNFPDCLNRFQLDKNITDGGVNYNGTLVDNPESVGLTYGRCVQYCGSGQESFNWSIFSQQFSGWLLPWLALVSQLPFGSESRLDNLVSGEFCCSVHRFGVPIFLP